MSKIWAFMIIFSIVIAFFTGYTENVITCIMDSGKNATENVISLIAMTCFWSGIFNMFENTKAISKFGNFFKKFIYKLFDKKELSEKSVEYVSMNIASNVLGVGNAATVNGIKAMEELQKENEELKSDNLEYQKIQDIFDKRTYRKKYLEERRKEEPNLLYPDADEIYRRYYELKKENQQLRNEYINIRQDAYIQGRAEEQQKAKQIIYKNYIPVQKIEKLIEELKQDDINMTRKYKGKKNITGELLGIDKVRVRAYREKTREINEKLHKLLSD